MASYLVLTPPGAARAEDRLFLRDGLSWIGLIVPPLHLLIHRLWTPLFFCLAFLLAAGATGGLTGMDFVGPLAWMMAGLYVGLEGAQLRLANRLAKGWSIIDIVAASRLSDAEAVHFANHPETIRAASPIGSPVWNTLPSAGSRLSGPALGMVDPFGGR